MWAWAEEGHEAFQVRADRVVHEVFGRWLLTSQTEPEDREMHRLARRMFAANPDLGALRTARMAAAIREGAAMIAGETGSPPVPSAPDRGRRGRRDRDGNHRHRTGHRARGGRGRRDALPRGRDRSALTADLCHSRIRIRSDVRLHARLARFLSEQCGHHWTTIDPAAANRRAIRSYTKVGFRSVGMMRQYERFHDRLLLDPLRDELTHDR